MSQADRQRYPNLPTVLSKVPDGHVLLLVREDELPDILAAMTAAARAKNTPAAVLQQALELYDVTHDGPDGVHDVDLRT